MLSLHGCVLGCIESFKNILHSLIGTSGTQGIKKKMISLIHLKGSSYFISETVLIVFTSKGIEKRNLSRCRHIGELNRVHYSSFYNKVT